MEEVYVIIPAHNEAKTIAQVIKSTKKYAKNIIVVDDGSTDNTLEAAKNEKVIALRHIVNLGKGGALKTGCDYAIEQRATHLIVMDADTQHKPEDIPRFLQELKTHDAVLSYRKMRTSMPAVLKFGNWFLNQSIKYLYGIDIKDSQCGFRAFSAGAYKKIRWRSNDYSMESEMIAKIGKHKVSFSEIPIDTIYADKYKGTTIVDGIKIIFNLLFWKVNNI